MDTNIQVIGSVASTVPTKGFVGVIVSVELECTASMPDFPDISSVSKTSVQLEAPSSNFTALFDVTKDQLLAWAKASNPKAIEEITAASIAAFPASFPFLPVK